jgi:hypothetical protein
VKQLFVLGPCETVRGKISLGLRLTVIRKVIVESFENVSQFKYFGTTVTNRNLIQEEIKRRLNSACYHVVQSLLSSRLLSKNLKIRIYKMIILPVVLYGCETWVFENRVLRRIFGPKRVDVTCE